MALTDDEILSICRAEREAALGDGDELARERARNLDYYYARIDKGEYVKDMPVLAGQSKAVSTDALDAVEAIMPQLMEIFLGGDNAVSFTPVGEEDEEQAEQETEYLNHIILKENDGWMLFYTHFKDALISKTGVWKWWWEEVEDWEDLVLEDKTPEEMTIIRAEIRKGEIELADMEEDELEADPETGLTTLRVRKKETKGRARVDTVTPEDFFIDQNATSPNDATMCGNKATSRAYELIEQGFDEELVSELKDADGFEDEDANARSPLGDEDTQQPVHSNDLMRRVEIIEYHIKLNVEGDDFETWQIITGNDDTTLLSSEKIAGIQYSTDCPYPTPHRAYGRALVDLLIDVQKISTALTRLMLNVGYYSLNPRPEVDMTQATKVTIADLHNNKPGVPIRSKGKAISWQAPPVVGFDIFGALEHMKTVAENRTGVVRNAQGLNPDTLHDTAKGVQELMTAAQHKVRMVARIFAETGVKDMFLGLHDLIVRHGRKPDKFRLLNKTVDIDPNKWGRRKDLTIDVGLGSNTKSQEQAFWNGIIGLQERGAQFGIANKKHFFNAAKKLLAAGNVRSPERYFADPDSEEEGQQEQEAPDPKLLEVQAKAQKDQAELQLKQEAQQQEFALKKARFEAETQLAIFRTQTEFGMAQEAAETQKQIELIKIAADADTKTKSDLIKASTLDGNPGVRFGGRIG